MIKRHHQLLTGLLIVQVVLSIVVFWPRPSTAEQSEPLFADLEAGEVTTLVVADGEGNEIRLEKVAGEWVHPEADDYPAKTAEVASFVERLLALTTGRLVTRSDASHRQLRVAADEFARRISFETGDGETRIVYLGSAPQFGSVHFRAAGQSETYLTSELSTQDANATSSAWIDLSYQRVAQEDVYRFTLDNANGTFVFEKSDEDIWTLVDLGEDETLDEAQVRDALRRASVITMKHPLGREDRPGYGLDNPAALVTLETDEKTVTLRVGARDSEDASYVIKSSESAYYVSVAETGVRALVENGRDAFLEQPSAPEGESEDS